MALETYGDACLPPDQLRGVVTTLSAGQDCSRRDVNYIPVDEAVIAWADGVIGSQVECDIECSSSPWSRK